MRDDSSRTAILAVVAQRESNYYVLNFFTILLVWISLSFSFYLMPAVTQFPQRVIQLARIETVASYYRSIVENRLPVLPHWTPFGVYWLSCQVMNMAILTSFICSAVNSGAEEAEMLTVFVLVCIWVVWHAAFALYICETS